MSRLPLPYGISSKSEYLNIYFHYFPPEYQLHLAVPCCLSAGGEGDGGTDRQTERERDMAGFREVTLFLIKDRCVRLTVLILGG